MIFTSAELAAIAAHVAAGRVTRAETLRPATVEDWLAIPLEPGQDLRGRCWVIPGRRWVSPETIRPPMPTPRAVKVGEAQVEAGWNE